ncbi:MAG: hypothetical protein DUD39_07425 [Coriobacteriaceae bacterium]|nr:MAG: hypothetical protein DUD39_07425 [Coriobacteriaceae bacterium]
MRENGFLAPREARERGLEFEEPDPITCRWCGIPLTPARRRAAGAGALAGERAADTRRPGQGRWQRLGARDDSDSEHPDVRGSRAITRAAPAPPSTGHKLVNE